MRKVMSISLQPELSQRLENSVKAEKSTRSEVVKKALEQYLYRQESKAIRNKLRPYAEKAGFYTEEDVFREIS